MKTQSILCVMLLILFGASALSKSVPLEFEDGGASDYTDSQAEKTVVPRIEERDGKKYYYWPQWNKWKNRKLIVDIDRTSHPNAQWWPEAGLGLFMHWGIVSEFEPNGEAWSGRWSEDKVKKGSFFPQTEIWAAAKTFNPTKYDPEKWMAAAKKAGFRYAVLTTKHHDGYALWDSDTALLGVRQCIDGRDLVKPFVQACRHNDLKVGFYYSGQDWYFEREYMNFSVQPGTIVNYKGECVDSLPKRPSGFSAVYQEYNEAQVKELIDAFDPDLWWGDSGHGMNVEKIRKMRPGIVCNNRDAGSGDHATAEGFGMAKPEYIKPVVANGWWWEVTSIMTGGSWHYDKYRGEKVYPSDSVLMHLAQARCMGGNLLANIGPRPDGTFQNEAYRLFNDMAEWMKTNKDSVFGINGGGPWPEKCNVPITCRDRVWYFHALTKHATAENPVVLKDAAKPVSVTLMRTGDVLPYDYKEGTLKLVVPKQLKAGKVTDVIVVRFGDDFDIEPFLFKHW
ncbi:MAG: alpha-L-fucosidase [Planctomycetota bacterium]